MHAARSAPAFCRRNDDVQHWYFRRYSLLREGSGNDFRGKVHFFNHGKEGAFYAMGVTLAAGYSLAGLRARLPNESFDELLEGIGDGEAGRQRSCCLRLTSLASVRRMRIRLFAAALSASMARMSGFILPARSWKALRSR